MDMHDMHADMATTASMEMMMNKSMTNGSDGHMPQHNGGHMTGNGEVDHSQHGTTEANHAGHGSASGTAGAHHVNTFFFLGTEATILFEEWVASSYTMFIGSCVAVGIIAMLYEGLKLIREILWAKDRHLMYNSKGCCSFHCSCLHVVQTVLHMIQMFISYCLMLVFMLFNGWLCLSIILGAGLGYLIFGWKKRTLAVLSSEDEDHCN